MHCSLEWLCFVILLWLGVRETRRLTIFFSLLEDTRLIGASAQPGIFFLLFSRLFSQSACTSTRGLEHLSGINVDVWISSYRFRELSASKFVEAVTDLDPAGVNYPERWWCRVVVSIPGPSPFWRACARPLECWGDFLGLFLFVCVLCDDDCRGGGGGSETFISKT